MLDTDRCQKLVRIAVGVVSARRAVMGFGWVTGTDEAWVYRWVVEFG